MSGILTIPWGMQASTSAIVYVDDVPNGKECHCVCPSCGAALVAKNAGTQNAHHFAHAPDNDHPGACEGWLHSTAKQLLYQRLTDALIRSEPLSISWQCGMCNCKHRGDVLKRVSAVRLETSIEAGAIRPDIYLEWDGKPAKLLEVVDTHPPEGPVHQFCQANKLPLLVFYVAGSEDLEQVICAPTLEPETHYVSVCPCPSCQYCGEVRSCDDTHRYCELCGTCVEDQQGQFAGSGDHDHCVDCKRLFYARARYARCYCCFAVRKYGVQRCENPEMDHRHCFKCGVAITRTNRFGDIYENCYECHKGLGPVPDR